MNTADRVAALDHILSVIEAGPWKADWDSLASRPLPAWYKDTRLGIFMHWGPFSVPAYHDWYARNMYIKDSEEYKHHLAHWGKHSEFGYKDFIPMFTMKDYDPKAWVRLFRESGADYIVPVAEHHDGFQNYGSDLSRWNAMDMGPRRDILCDLLTEGDQVGLTRGVSSHRVEHWFFFSHGRQFDSDVKEALTPEDLYWPAMPEGENQDLFSEPAPSEEFLTDWLLRSCELVDKAHPRIFYFDWWVQHAAVRPYLMKFAAYYYNVSEAWGGGIINYKHDAFPFGVAVPDMERGQFAEPKPFLWQSDTSVMYGSWCYSVNPERCTHKPIRELIWTLVDVVAKNGRLLLNIGPKPDGTLSDEDLASLRGLGAWMKVNGEAIHGTNLWRLSAEGPTSTAEGQFADAKSTDWTSEDFRFMCRGNKIYAINMVCPENGVIRIRSLRHASETGTLPLFHGIPESVEVLGCDQPIRWERTEEALVVDLGSWRSDLPVTVKLTVK